MSGGIDVQNTLGNMEIRRGIASDAGEMSSLIHRLSHHFLASPNSAEAAMFLEATGPARMAQYIAEQNRLFAVARDETGLIGFIALHGGSRISQFFVEPEHQGKGIGRQLWSQVRALAGSPVHGEYTVDSSRNAVAVYERLGFKVAGPITEAGGVVFVPMQRPSVA